MTALTNNAGTTTSLLAPGGLLTIASGEFSFLNLSGGGTYSVSNLHSQSTAASAVTVVGSSALVASNSSFDNLTLNAGTFETGTGASASIGALNLAGNGTIDTVTAGTTITISGLISGSGELTFLGAGKAVVSNAANTYSGGTDISGSTVAISNGGSLGMGAVILDGATLSTTGNVALAAAISVPTASTFNVTAGLTTLTGSLSGSGLVTKTGSGTLDLSSEHVSSNPFTNTATGGVALDGGTLLVDSAAELGVSTNAVTLNGGTLQFYRPFTLANNLVLAGPGTLSGNGGIRVLSGTLSGSLSGSGVLTIYDGEFKLADTFTNTSTGGTVLGYASGSLIVGSDAQLGALSAPLTFTSNSTLDIDASTPFSSARNISIVSSGRIQFSGSVTSAALTGSLSGAGDLSVYSGTLDLSSPSFTNTSTGNLILESSTVIVSSDAQLGAASSSVFLDGSTVSTPTGISSARSYILNGPGTFDVAAGTTTSLTGTVSGPGQLTKQNTGTLVMSGATSYTGNTVISGGTLVYAPVTDGTYSGGITGNGTLIKSGANLLNLSGTSSGFAGSTTVAGGTLLVNGTSGARPSRSIRAPRWAVQDQSVRRQPC